MLPPRELGAECAGLPSEAAASELCRRKADRWTVDRAREYRSEGCGVQGGTEAEQHRKDLRSQ